MANNNDNKKKERSSVSRSVCVCVCVCARAFNYARWDDDISTYERIFFWPTREKLQSSEFQKHTKQL